MSEAYCATLTGIGAIVRKGSREQKTALLHTLRQHAASSECQDRRSAGADAGQNGWWSPHHTFASSESLPIANLGQYSVALKENGDQHGFVPEYAVQGVSTSPPQFKAVVSFKGFSFEGVARNKKQARHLAAREACNYLKIQG